MFGCSDERNLKIEVSVAVVCLEEVAFIAREVDVCLGSCGVRIKCISEMIFGGTDHSDGRTSLPLVCSLRLIYNLDRGRRKNRYEVESGPIRCQD